MVTIFRSVKKQSRLNFVLNYDQSRETFAEFSEHIDDRERQVSFRLST